MSTLPPLSALAKFDDLVRCSKELTAGVAEEKFLMFLHQHELLKMDYQRLVDEAKHLQGRLDEQTQETISNDKKLNYARKMLEAEKRARREAETEKAQLESLLDTVRTVLLKDNTMRDETRKHLQVLNSYPKKRKSNHRYIEADPLNDINSTGSFLSDFSLSQSGGDNLDDQKPSATVKMNKMWKKHRPSLNNSGILNVSGKKSRSSIENRRSTRQSLLECGVNDKIISQTKLTIPADAFKPIRAQSTIETIPHSLPTPSTSSSDENIPDNAQLYLTPMKKSSERFKTPMKTPSTKGSSTKFFTPSAPSLDDLDNIKDVTDVYATVKKKTATMSVRKHTFNSKTIIMPETCGFCSQKISFGSVASKCSECRTCVHQKCRDKLTVSCLPQSATPIASKAGNSLSTIGDYTPSLAPMVPALIVHCVNEIETRGLSEVGLYRISGSDRDVKGLTEKFLRNNGIPNLAEVDVHVLCGCVKNFLRSLSDHLIPMSMWSTFSNAAQIIPSEEEEGALNKEMCRAVERLPQPNRDTLAYLIMHFQRISECPVVLMPLSNFAKIFGPTIVGFSCASPNQHQMVAEVQVQFSVMFALMNIPTDYWNKFILLDQPTREEEAREIETYGSKFYSGTPSMKVMRKERKFYNTPPYSAISKKKK